MYVYGILLMTIPFEYVFGFLHICLTFFRGLGEVVTQACYNKILTLKGGEMMNKIMSLIGCSISTAGLVLALIDIATLISLLVSLTGIGITAAAAIIAYRIAIKKILWTAGKAAAIQL
jgi:hypothetical protein